MISPNVNLLKIDDGFEDLFSGKLQVWDLLIIEIFATFMFVILCLGIGDLQGKDSAINAMAVSLSLYLAIQ